VTKSGRAGFKDAFSNSPVRTVVNREYSVSTVCSVATLSTWHLWLCGDNDGEYDELIKTHTLIAHCF
jgi:hypothetical protein